MYILSSVYVLPLPSTIDGVSTNSALLYIAYYNSVAAIQKYLPTIIDRLIPFQHTGLSFEVDFFIIGTPLPP